MSDDLRGDTCPSDEELKAFCSGQLSPFGHRSIQRHVDACARCRGIVAGHKGGPDVTGDEEEWLGRELAQPERYLPFADEPECGAAVVRVMDQATGPYHPAGCGEPLVLPRRLDRYELLEQRGRGGMGVVYKARHQVVCGGWCAIKVLPPDRVEKPQAIDRFLREMRALGELPAHPHLVKALDAGESGNELFLVMEYIDGPDLGALVAEQGPLPWQTACAYIGQAARGLEHLHAYQYVHRDIKPSNLLLAPDRVVKVSDLGLVVKQADGVAANPDAGLTAAVQLLGTPGFMAPEQIENPHAVTPRTDVYSLGCTLTVLLGGTTPDHLPEGTPATVRQVVREMTDPDPNRRYSTATDVVLALEAVVAEKPVVIAVMGTNGGVGKGTFIAFLAQLLADSGNEVAVVDYDLGNYGSTAHAQHWYRRPENQETVKTVFDHFAPHATDLIWSDRGEDAALWDVTPTSLKQRGRRKIWLVPALRPNVQLATFNVIANIPPKKEEGRGPDGKVLCVSREERLLQVTREIIARCSSQKPVKFVLIDCGAGVNPIYSAAFAEAAYGFLLTIPDPAFQGQVPRLRDQLNIDYPGRFDAVSHHVIVNKVTSEGDKIAAAALGPSGFIPNDPLLKLQSYSGKELDIGTEPDHPGLRQDPWDQISTDYDLGYGEVQQAIHELLRRVLRQEHRHCVRDELEIRSGWVRVPGAARKRLTQWWYRFLTWLGRGSAAVLGMLLVALSCWVAFADTGPATWISLVVVVGLLAATGYTVFAHERRRKCLRQVAAWADEPPKQIRKLLRIHLKTADRATRKWLYELANPPLVEVRINIAKR